MARRRRSVVAAATTVVLLFAVVSLGRMARGAAAGDTPECRGDDARDA